MRPAAATLLAFLILSGCTREEAMARLRSDSPATATFVGTCQRDLELARPAGAESLAAQPSQLGLPHDYGRKHEQSRL
jgi:hypothetical protein